MSPSADAVDASVDPVDLSRVVRAAAVLFGQAGIASAQTDAELLAAHVLGIGRAELVAAMVRGSRPSPEQLSEFAALVERRASREPLQHLTGRAPFRRLELLVGPGVFVPRPETELLVEAALAELTSLAAAQPEREQFLVIDLCTGSGAVALAIADEAAEATGRAVRVLGLELEPDALAWARLNAEEAKRPARTTVELLAGDVDGAAAPGGPLAACAGSVDLITANPPYIPPDAVPVDPEVAEHDPRPALYGGGSDGLRIPGAVLTTAQLLLRPGALLLMEHADVQGPAVRAMALAAGYASAETLLDLTGRERVLRARADAGPRGKE